MPSSAAPTFGVSTNAQELTAKLNRMSGEIEDPKGLLESIRGILVAGEQEVFASEGATLGWAWNAIVDPSRKRGSSPLVESGQMKASVAGFGAGKIRGNTLRVHPDPFYSRFHQFGTHTMDARPFTGISESTTRMILQEFERATGQVLT